MYSIFRQIEGTLIAPSYMTDDARPGTTLVIGADNLPAYQGNIIVPFTVLIPRSCLDRACPIVNYGHGLFSSRAEVRGADRTGRGWGRVGRGWDVDGTWMGRGMGGARRVGGVGRAAGGAGGARNVGIWPQPRTLGPCRRQTIDRTGQWAT